MCLTFYAVDVGEVRLAGGSIPSEGRVEIWSNGSWGTVCDNNWDRNDAKVVCKMLGFGTALMAPGGAYFGEGSGDILLDNVGCTGTENNLGDCPHNALKSSTCEHGNDASVVCSSDYIPRKRIAYIFFFSNSENVQLNCI